MERSEWPQVLAEASFLLGELVGTDLIPEEWAEQANRLSVQLAEIGRSLSAE